MMMREIYYKLPIDFRQLIEKKEAEKTNIEHSIAQYINLIATTSFGECKFDELFGCEIWEMDFDFLLDQNTLKNKIEGDLIAAIKRYESRLNLVEVEVEISEAESMSFNSALKMKKKINIQITGFIKKTNRAFNFYGYFFVGPLSYI